MIWKLGIVLGIVCLSVLGVHAQDEAEDRVTTGAIDYGRSVTDTITERSFYDVWRFQASGGDVIVVSMQAGDDLAPLIGVSNPGGDIIARSDEPGPVTPVNGTARLQLQIPSAGEYAIIATRIGNQDGTTTGSYTLTLDKISQQEAYADQDVTFRCGDVIATTATTLHFLADPNVEAYRISVYGMDGFQPVIRTVAGIRGELSDCSRDIQGMAGDSVILPDEIADTPIEIAEDSSNAARIVLSGGSMLSEVELTIAAVEGTAGRYAIVIDGMTLSQPEQQNILYVQMGPLARETRMLVYMVKDGQNRIDPVLALRDNDEDIMRCDDAGRHECDRVPSFVDAGVYMAIDEQNIVGDRFSAGLRLETGTIERQQLLFYSRNSSSGDYAVFLIGELPQ